MIKAVKSKCMTLKKKLIDINVAGAAAPEEQILKYQKLVCKNPACVFVIKKICFSEGGEKTIVEGGDVHLMYDNELPYYECPQCGAGNFIEFQGENIILEIITGYVLHGRNEALRKDDRQYPESLDTTGNYYANT